MTLKKFILIFALFIGITGMIKAQNQYGTWTSVGLEKKTGNWNFGAETEVRTIHYLVAPYYLLNICMSIK